LQQVTAVELRGRFGLDWPFHLHRQEATAP
jgi:hypothetical protein